MSDGDAGARDGRADAEDESEPDYRFSLANERTFLAYLRTGLALGAAGIAATQFLTDVEPGWLKRLIAVVLAVAGVATSVGAYYRWRRTLIAMRRGAPLPRTLLPLGLALAVLVVLVLGVYLVTFG
jgi:putative membrane protein